MESGIDIESTGTKQYGGKKWERIESLVITLRSVQNKKGLLSLIGSQCVKNFLRNEN